VKPIPVEFHIGPLPIHTYGIGLAITFWVAYRYYAKRLRNNGYPDEWLGTAFIWIIVSAIVGARAVHVIANLSYYTARPADIFAIWDGGLTSFGGLALAVPVGMWCAHRWCPELRLGRALDLVSPVLVLAWSIGRLLGPQLMVAGGGKLTNAWYGMYYSGEVGKRLPVPLFQSAECFVIWLIVLQVEKWAHARGDRPVGLVTAASATLWGLSRFVDERFWLTHDVGTDAVEGASIAFVVVGLAFMGWLVVRGRRRGWGEPEAVVAAGADDEEAAAQADLATPAESHAASAGGDDLDGDLDADVHDDAETERSLPS
jgi:phosphatidylglycerol:prolipoprotein diacylglycerol transferase